MNYLLGLILILLSPFVLTWYAVQLLLWGLWWEMTQRKREAEPQQGKYYGENTYGYRR